MTQQLIEAQEEEKKTESFAFSLGLTPSRTKEKYENQKSSIGEVGRASSSAAFTYSAQSNKSVFGKPGNTPIPNPKNGKPPNKVNGTNGRSSWPGISHTHRFESTSRPSLLNDFVQVKEEPGTSDSIGFGEWVEDGSLWRSPRVNKGNTNKYEDYTVGIRSNGYLDGRKSPLFSNKKRRVDDPITC